MVENIALYNKIELPESLGHLRMVCHLGKGGMGNVFKAVEPNGCYIAVKIFHPEVIASLVHNENIFSDWQRATRVKHPNLCRLLELYRDRQIVFLTMEYVKGQSLRSIIKCRRHCPVEYGLKLSLETIRGVSALHTVGLIHGDVRPVNIVVSEKSNVKLIDYGVRYPTPLNKPNKFLDNRTYTGYLAPEVWLGSEPNQLSDVYSLGVLIYHLLTGGKPRKKPEQKNIKPLRVLQKSVSVEIEELVLNALSLKPEFRPTSALEMLKYLDGAFKIS